VHLVQDVAIVVDRPAVVSGAGVEHADLPQNAVSVFADLVGPWERYAGARDRAEAIEMAGVEELGQPAAADLPDAPWPVKFEQLGRVRNLRRQTSRITSTSRGRAHGTISSRAPRSTTAPS
jgi:hypothetical protein